MDDVDLSFIRLPDLYAILGNAIDNAIEYVEKQDDPSMRAISMRIESRGMFVGIQIINPYTDAPLPSGELPHSSKEDAANHGFGMKSIRYLAEKYGGVMEYSADGGRRRIHSGRGAGQCKACSAHCAPGPLPAWLW